MNVIALVLHLFKFKFSFFCHVYCFVFSDVFPHVPINLSFNIKETTADYFHGVVLQRYGSASNEKLEPTTNVNYSLALNSAIVWIIVCVCLRKGKFWLNSYFDVHFHSFLSLSYPQKEHLVWQKSS